MPRGHPNTGFASVPCEDCRFRPECARSAWSCSAFNRYVARVPWKPEQRGPNLKATQAAIARREQDRKAERAEEIRARTHARIARWRARNPDKVREYERRSRLKGQRAVYQRIKADPVRLAAMQEYRRRYREANRDKLRVYFRERARRQRAEKRAAKKVPAAASRTAQQPLPAGAPAG